MVCCEVSLISSYVIRIYMKYYSFIQARQVLLTFAFLFIIIVTGVAQKANFQPFAVGFYNLENLFDTKNDTLIDDEEFLPEGKKAWTEEKYKEKVANMAAVISQLGKELCSEGLSILAVSEIENEKVLIDLVEHPLLKSRNYGVVHVDSKDKRGIDVAFIYDKDHFIPESHKTYLVDISEGDTVDVKHTRDVFLVSGLLDGERIHLTANHWPSRSGGEKRGAKNRNKAAMINRHILDSLLVEDPNAKLIVLGDMNDDPTNDSMIKHLRAKKKTKKVTHTDIYNPMHALFDKGLGTTAYRDSWSLFDQILLSPAFLNKETEGVQYHKAVIYNKNYLLQKKGKYKGYPLRTFDGDVYQGGYSDHLPVYVYLIKETRE